MQRWLWLPAFLMLGSLTALPVQAQGGHGSSGESALPQLEENPEQEEKALQPEDAAAPLPAPDDANYPEDFSPTPEKTIHHDAYSAFGEDETDPRIEWGGEPQVSE
ncbi:MAG: hypothetical protein HYS17_10555 [Micavibrio aeruginosavorus]|uniref:Uncharacterized protein n=1 Tax=Micavibrio aeruginosavorus TaxID=349221 RepID=A0A7T5R1P6_9BACT|nr:MAG: hypothetical protein HYS17_10555 [Micavibrio aeruginosavorus]